MFGIILLIAIILIALYLKLSPGTLFLREKSGSNEITNINFKKVIVSGAILVLAIIGGIINPYKLEKTDSASVAFKVNLLGSDRGVAPYAYTTGWTVVNTLTEEYVSYPTYQQTVKYEPLTTFAKGGFPIVIKPTFNYDVSKNNAGSMYIALRKELPEIENGWMGTQLMNAINEVINKYSVDYIFNNRELVEKEIEGRAKDKVKQWFTLSSFRTNLTPPQSLQNAVTMEAQAVKEAQAETQKAIKEEAIGRTKIAQAKADSANLVIRASAEAEANKLKERSLTPLLIQQQAIEAWKEGGSKVPTTYSGNGSYIPFVKTL